MTVKAGPLQAREYQKQLFAKALTSNVIACVETGSGKTLVAALLLEHMYSQEVARTRGSSDHRKRRKLSLFLVNLVPLVHQQAAFLDANTSLRVALLYGELEADTSSRSYWDALLDGETAVVVCTARIALNSIIHAYLSLEDVNLVVFDEAHHAIGNNEYARIMSYYRLVHPEERPKILGLTASPLSSAGTFNLASTELEKVLDASIFTVPLSAKEELEAFVSRPTELIVEYSSQRLWTSTIREPAILEAHILKRMPTSDDFQKILERMSWYWEEHGSYFSDLAWLASKRELRSRTKRKSYHAKRLMAENLVNEETTKAVLRLKEGARVSHQIGEILDDIEYVDHIALTEENSSPKLRKLIDTLACFESQADSFCGIIFCNRRLSALALRMLIQKTPRLSFLHPEALIGHGGQANAAGTEGMSWEEQCEILSRLRRRAPTNLVIATSVLEEGLDIMPVNCVIRFDLPDHHVGYVQSRGRARSSESTYILLAEENNLDHAQLLSRIGHAERQMRDWLAALPEDRLATVGEHEDDSAGAASDETAAMMGQSYCDERTGARIWPVDATSLLSRYVAVLKTDEYCPDGPVYELEGTELAWKVSVRLPASSRLSGHTGPFMRSKAAAKSAAAFETCVKLHQLDELDEHLSPRKKTKISKEPTMALVGDFSGMGEGVEGGSENTLSFFPAIPVAFRLPAILKSAPTPLQVFVHVVNFPGLNAVGGPMEPIALVTATHISQAGMCDIVLTEYQGSKDVRVPPLSEPIFLELTNDQLELARAYTLGLLALIARREYECDALPYLLLPLARGTADRSPAIDWTVIHRTLGASSDVQPMALHRLDEEGYLDDLLLLDSPHCVGQARPYRCLQIDQTQTPYSRIKACPSNGLREDADDSASLAPATSYWEYYQSLPGRRKATGSPPRSDQPMLAVRRLPRRLENFLTTAYKKGRQHRGDNSFLIPELTWVHSFGASIYESALLLPSILCRLSQILIAKDLNDRVFRGALDTDQTVIAMTGPTAQHPVHYQRHEYLGDALLKSHVSAYVFAISDQRVEGQLHLHRREIVSNINLIEKSKHLEIGTMLYTRSFTRKNWTPPLCRIKGRTVHTGDIVQHISPKMVADVVESVIGAAVLTSERPLLRSSQVSYVGTPLCMNVDLGLQAIVDFGLLPPHCNTFEKVRKLWTDQVWPKRIAEKWDQRLHAGALRNLETQIGYKFNTPHLALESMTHASHLSSLLPSYQRLEFLGDALLDFMINCWLFQKYPDINEGQLTTLKDLAVCNQALCALSVYLKLHKFLQMGLQVPFAAALSDLTTDLSITRKATDAWLDRDVESNDSKAETPDESSDPYASPSPPLQQGSTGAEEPPLIHYWADVREIKALADLVESLLGAVFVDSGFSMEATWTFFSRFYLPWFERYCCYDAFLQRTRHDRMKSQAGAEKLSPVIRARREKVKEKQVRVDELRQDEEGGGDDMDDDSDDDMGLEG